MTNTHRGILRSAFTLVAIALLLAGCAQPAGTRPAAGPTDSYGSSVPPWSFYYVPPDDPYHYRCTGAAVQHG
jgi:hypothetical protein